MAVFLLAWSLTWRGLREVVGSPCTRDGFPLPSLPLRRDHAGLTWTFVSGRLMTFGGRGGSPSKLQQTYARQIRHTSDACFQNALQNYRPRICNPWPGKICRMGQNSPQMIGAGEGVAQN